MVKPAGEWVNCATCGKQIWKQASRIKRSRTGKFTCSIECRARLHTEFWRENKDSIRRRDPESKTARSIKQRASEEPK